MTLRLLSTCSVLLLLIGGCGRVFTEPDPVDRDVVAELEEPFEVTFGNIARITDTLTIFFAVVRTDSRCPADVTCVSPGEATVELHVTPANGSKTALLLSLPGLVPTPYFDNTVVQQQGFRFTLLQVDPYPAVGLTPSFNEYRVMMVVDRIEDLP